MYDAIIVGGGISGLYTAYKLRKRHPHWRMALLESADHLGGRAETSMFHGVRILHGAGIGRRGYDHLLLGLCRDLGVETHDFVYEMGYTSDIPYPADLQQLVRDVKRGYDPLGKHRGKTFKEVALDVVGQQRYALWRVSNGYTDYEEEDPDETFKTFRFDDSGAGDGWTKGVSIPWKDVIDAMASSFGQKHIHLSERVTKILPNEDGSEFLLSTKRKSHQDWNTRRVVVSTDIRGVSDLVPGANAVESPYRGVMAQPFLRVYAHFTGPSVGLMKRLVPHTTVTATPMYKMIPIDAEKGVYMIAYTDNAGALYFRKRPLLLQNTHAAHKGWSRLCENALLVPKGSLCIDDISVHYWEVGTHYFRPLDKKRYSNRRAFLQKVQHPMHHLWVVGEGMSRNQGWTEGALESVEAIFPTLLTSTR